MPSIEDVRTRVRSILSDFIDEDLGIDDHGRFTFRFDSVQVYVDVRAMDSDVPDSTVVRIVSPMNFQVPESTDFYRWVATHGAYDYGHLRAVPRPAGVDLEFRHSLLGDYLDAEELAQAVTAVATTADELDDQVKELFGGVRFHEDAAWGEPLA